MIERVWIITAGDNTHGYHAVGVSASVDFPKLAMTQALNAQFRYHGGKQEEDLWHWKVISPDEVWLYSTSTVFAKRFQVRDAGK